MELHDHLVSWNHAFCTIFDVRHINMKAEESLSVYSVPASIFLMSIQGRCLNCSLAKKLLHSFKR